MCYKIKNNRRKNTNYKSESFIIHMGIAVKRIFTLQRCRRRCRCCLALSSETNKMREHQQSSAGSSVKVRSDFLYSFHLVPVGRRRRRRDDEMVHPCRTFGCRTGRDSSLFPFYILHLLVHQQRHHRRRHILIIDRCIEWRVPK